jgi:hypothetical protein
MLGAQFNPLKLKRLTRILDRKQSDDHARCMLMLILTLMLISDS